MERLLAPAICRRSSFNSSPVLKSLSQGMPNTNQSDIVLSCAQFLSVAQSAKLCGPGGVGFPCFHLHSLSLAKNSELSLYLWLRHSPVCLLFCVILIVVARFAVAIRCAYDSFVFLSQTCLL